MEINMDTVKQLKRKLLTLEFKRQDLGELTLTTEELEKIAKSKEHKFRGNSISLENVRSMAFWVQGLGTKHTCTAEEMKRIFTLVPAFSKVYNEYNKLLNELEVKLKALPDTAVISEEINFEFSRIKLLETAVTHSNELLKATLYEIRASILARPEIQAPHINEEAEPQYLIDLFSDLKSDLIRRKTEGELDLLAVKKQDPADLLVVFIKSVLNDNTHRYPPHVYERVSEVVSEVCKLDAGIEARDRAIEAAFNHGTKKYGLLNHDFAAVLINELSTFIKSKEFQAEVVPVEPPRSGPSF